MSAMRVGFIGLGTMGASMAANLARAGGVVLTVHDMRREAASALLEGGARWADSPAALGAACEVVFTSLPGPREVETVGSALIGSMAPGGIIVDLSTNAVSAVRALHAAAAERGVHVLDAPISGGPRGAAIRKLAFFVGGDRSVFDRVRPLLDAMGDRAILVGGIGAGSIAKLAHNLSGYALNAIMAEVFAMGAKAGLEPLALYAAIRQGVHGRRRTYDGVTEQFLPNSYDPPAFQLRLAHKDVALACALGREVGVPMRFAALTLEEMTEALNRGWGHRDSRSAMLLELERAGVEIAVDRAKLQAVIDADGKDF
ncbi:NAD(P)-dependent oxidoreductase [Pseudoroseomonas cervicalis]|uniref:NAD(P)-dependent oxidoreductase n=1 Tax=Teichococcus cervicalis TaxID=204525 RepID=UPI0022F14AC0|nr:NAD(P)-dependent oxidoreductase [Pseudoroseomonas cervicalis]WBV45210.1 NAD(P)-dependent oxidoreductase [Pseudoroseomonas cervicalis]